MLNKVGFLLGLPVAEWVSRLECWLAKILAQCIDFYRGTEMLVGFKIASVLARWSTAAFSADDKKSTHWFLCFWFDNIWQVISFPNLSGGCNSIVDPNLLEFLRFKPLSLESRVQDCWSSVTIEWMVRERLTQSHYGDVRFGALDVSEIFINDFDAVGSPMSNNERGGFITDNYCKSLS